MGKTFTTGEFAELNGLTVRTLQHYDNIGLLKPSSRTDGGRRCYNERDLLKLQQLTFYKSLGFTLTEIKEKITEVNNLTELEKILDKQSMLLARQILKVQSSFVAIEASLKTIKAGFYPDYILMAEFISSFNDTPAWEWVPSSIDAETLSLMDANILSPLETLNSFALFKNLSMEAIVMEKTSVPPDSEDGERLAKRWWDMVMKLTGGKAKAIKGVLKFNENRDKWPESEKRLIEAAQEYIEDCLKHYFASGKAALTPEIISILENASNDKG